MLSLILTLIGRDRPGLVDSVAAVVRQHQGNWVESRMAHLAGHFAGIVRVEVAEDRAENLLTQLQGLQAQGLSIVAKRDASPSIDSQVRLVWLELVGNDRPGIVSEVSHVLAQHQVNVEEFSTERQGAPNSGAALFRATAALRLPAQLSVAALQVALEEIAVDLMVDIQIGQK